MLTDQEIREIWHRHRERNILTRALGPDPVLFAQEVISAWERHRCPTIPEEAPRSSTDS